MTLDELFANLTSFRTWQAREAWMEPRITPPTWVKVGPFLVSADYMGIGGCPLPMTAGLATRMARRFGALLPTRVLVDTIYRAPGATRIPAFTLTKRTVRSWRTIHEKCLPHYGQGLNVGHRKDVIRHPAEDDRLVIYGWNGTSGPPIQGLNRTSHNRRYTDYSQGERIVQDTDGMVRKLYLSGDPLVSSVGRINPEYYWKEGT